MSSPEDELAKAKADYEKAKAQAKARYDKARARHETAARKLDTRRKVILGGALMELAERDRDASRMLSRIVDGLSREQDRKPFEEWDRPKPEVPGSEAASSPSSFNLGSGR